MAVIARTLRARRHDVIAVQELEQAAWRGLDDAALFEVAQAEGRAIVTDNVAHCRVLAQRSLDAGAGHFGALYLSNASLPRHRHELFVSHVVVRLEEVLSRYPGIERDCVEDFV